MTPALGPMMRKIILDLVWPEGLLGKVGRLLGALSIVELIRHGFRFGFGQPFLLVLGWYDRFIEAAFGRFTPILAPLLADIGAYFGFHLVLYPHWKHVLVLMGVYFSRYAGNSFRLKLTRYAVFLTMLGILVALTASLAAGAISLAESTPCVVMTFAFVPLAGFTVFSLIDGVWAATFLRKSEAELRREPAPTWWGYYRMLLGHITFRAVAGAVVIVCAYQLPFVHNSQSPALFLVALIVLCLAIYWLARGAAIAHKVRGPNESLLTGFWHTAFARIGAAMLGVAFWVIVLLATNAGLQFYGL